MLGRLFENFFTHKDFLPPPEEWPGTLFTPLQIVFCLSVAIFIAISCVLCSKKSEKSLKKIFFVLWLIMFVTEPIVIFWEAASGASFAFSPTADLPLWDCSIFLYAAPFAIFGKGDTRYAACGYICTLGLLGGAVNFFYPATYISRYSCISFAGFRTIFYHGSMIFTAVTMLMSGYHSFRGVTTLKQLILPIIPTLIVSIPANIANFTIANADYMFFKLESFFFAPIGRATPDWLSIVIVYILYLIIHSAPYLPSYISNLKHRRSIDKSAVI